MSDREPETWDRLEDLFGAALEHCPDSRTAFVAEACAGDQDLQAQLEELLDAHDNAERVLPAASASRASLARALENECAVIPKRIGRYTIKGVIASGGMGTVYEAEQEHPRRTVAVKVMRTGMASRSALRRFEYESQLLARLRHPAIAQVFEAGTHDDGAGPMPYFAMEYIPDARPVTDYANASKLGVRERLELFAQICQAVEHGHTKGVIHRDLKPSNLLVDADGRPKIIDFGVARCTDADVAVTTMQTDVGQLIGTLQYMSPEQCAADPGEIDTRSDVYALGVVLYELLCGKLPYDVTRLAVYEATRVVRDQSPPRLSSIDARLRGDAETIVAKALEKDRERRYRSAAALADDIRRYLTGDAVLARPPSMIYNLRVFARRNKPLVSGVAAVFVVLVAGIVGTTAGLMQARKERDVAAFNIEEMDLILKPLIEGLEATDPEVALGDEPTMRDWLEQVGERIQTDPRFAAHPLAEATLRTTIGRTYRHLRYLEAAERHLRTALEIRRRELGREHPDTVSGLHELGQALMRQGMYKDKEAQACFREVLDLYRTAGLPESPAVAGAMRDLGYLRQREDPDEALAMLLESKEMFTRVLGTENPEGAREVSWCLNNLGIFEGRRGDLDAAERYHRQALTMRQDVLGAGHPHVVYSLFNLANIKKRKGEPKEVERLRHQAKELCRSVLGDHPLTVAALGFLGDTVYAKGDLAEAESLLREALALKTRLAARQPSSDKNWAFLRMSLGRVLRDQGNPENLEESVQLLEEAVQEFAGQHHPWTPQARRHLAESFIQLARYDQAEEQLLEAHRTLESADDQRDLPKTIQRLVTLYEAWGKPDQADAWRARLDSETSEHD